MAAKLSDQKKEHAKALLYLNPEISERDMARQVGICNSKAHDLKKEIIADDPDEWENVRASKKKEFINQAWDTVQKALKLADKRFTKALEDEEAIEELIEAVQDQELTQAQKKTLISRLNGLQMTNIRDIAVALGTIYDKQAIASGEPTQIIENHKEIPDLVKDTEERLKELKKLTG